MNSRFVYSFIGVCALHALSADATLGAATRAASRFAEQAKHASTERDNFIQEARNGIKHLADFNGDASNCTAELRMDICNKAREEQKHAVQRMRDEAKKASQHSKKAGQEACKFARKAGISEHVAEHERDEAEGEAERLEEQAEQEADKATDRVDHVFTDARAAAQKAGEAKPAADVSSTQGESSSESMNLLVVPQVLAEQSQDTLAEKAKVAIAGRDSLIKKAHKGIQDIVNFAGNASVCMTGANATICNKARDEQMKALRQLRDTAKKATQDSKKAGQVACKFARKAGIRGEHLAEHERDEAEREAERLEEQAGQEADKATDRVDHLFAEARAASRESSINALAAIVSDNSFQPSSVIGCISLSCVLLIGIVLIRRRAPATNNPLEQPILFSMLA